MGPGLRRDANKGKLADRQSFWIKARLLSRRREIG